MLKNKNCFATLQYQKIVCAEVLTKKCPTISRDDKKCLTYYFIDQKKL